MEPEVNPANVPTAAPEKRVRIPMSVPSRKLEVPPIPGYHLYWFLESNVPRAIEAGYEFVKSEDVPISQHNVASRASLTGNTDLGGNIRVVGGVGESGKAEHLVLMKIRQEWYNEDRKVIEERNAQIMQAIFRDEQIMGAEGIPSSDRSQMYVKTSQPGNVPLFQRRRRK